MAGIVEFERSIFRKVVAFAYFKIYFICIRYYILYLYYRNVIIIIIYFCIYILGYQHGFSIIIYILVFNKIFYFYN